MSKKPLPVPDRVTESSEDATEILRAWIVDDRLVCSLRPDAFADRGVWGVALADVARHVADALHQLHGRSHPETLAEIRALFLAELETPRSRAEVSGQIVDPMPPQDDSSSPRVESSE